MSTDEPRGYAEEKRTTVQREAKWVILRGSTLLIRILVNII